jgi:hypothetical protein
MKEWYSIGLDYIDAIWSKWISFCFDTEEEAEKCLEYLYNLSIKRSKGYKSIFVK